MPDHDLVVVGASAGGVEAPNRPGRAITCRVTCSPLVGGDDTVRGVIMVTEEWPRTNGP